MAADGMMQLAQALEAKRRRRKAQLANPGRYPRDDRSAETAPKIGQPKVVRRRGAEDDAYASYTSGRTGGNVRGPLSGMTTKAGDVRIRRRGQPS